MPAKPPPPGNKQTGDKPDLRARSKPTSAVPRDGRRDGRAVSLEAGRALQRALDSAPAAATAGKTAGAGTAAAQRALDRAQIELHIPSSPITPTMIKARIQELRRAYAVVRSLGPNQPLRIGDVIQADVTGYVDGRVFLAQVGTWYELAPNAFLPGLFEALQGLRSSHSTVVRLKLPASYPIEELRGKSAVFAVAIRQARQRFVPAALDPAFLEATGTGAKTAAELEQIVGEQLLQERARSLVDEARFAFLRELYCRCVDDEAPQALIEDELRRRWKEHIGDAMVKQGISLEEQKRSFTAFCTTAMRGEARRTVWEYRTLEAVADHLNLRSDAVEVSKLVSELHPELKKGDVDNMFYHQPGIHKELLKNLRLHRALLALLAQAKISFDGAAGSRWFNPLPEAKVSNATATEKKPATTSSPAVAPVAAPAKADVTATRGLSRPPSKAPARG